MTKTMVSTHAITGGVDTHAGDGRGRVARRAAQDFWHPARSRARSAGTSRSGAGTTASLPAASYQRTGERRRRHPLYERCIMRKLLALGASAAVLAVIPATAVAASSLSPAPASPGSHHLYSEINCQELAWRTTPASTTSPAYSTLPGLTSVVVSAGGMIVNVSVVLRGGPAALRLTDTSV